MPQDRFSPVPAAPESGTPVPAAPAPGTPLPPGAMRLTDAFNLAIRHYQEGRPHEAAGVCRAILNARPDHALSLHLLGVLSHLQGEPDQAIALILRAVAADPGFADAYGNLGTVFQAGGRPAEAVECLKRAAALKPEAASTHYNLGNALAVAGRFAEAAAAYQQAHSLDPRSPAILCNLGNALLRQLRYDDAVVCYRRAIVLQPDYADGHNNLGLAMKELGRIDEAIASFQQAIAFRPGHADALSNLGSALKDQARHAEAAAAFSRSLALKPTFASTHSNLVFLRNYLPEESETSLRAAHEAWDERHARPLLPASPRFANGADPERRLKVGYVSPDFRTHSVSYFFEPLITHHDRGNVEVFGYAEVTAPSATTERLRSLADHWRSTIGLSDAALAERIRADGIDILVDLAGHTSGNRLLAFARRPAPVQVTWLGYPNTTGLTAIDYRITDAEADPPGTEASARERLVRLPGGFLCYTPPSAAPAVAPPPGRANGFITFGSFNNLAKLTGPTVAAWADILRRVPRSRLLLKCKQLADPGTSRHFLNRFAALGVAPERIETMSWAPSPQDHLALYGRVDLALDTFPYNGTTTTCEALWMGVPVLTLRGDRHAGRVGVSLLTRAGLPALIAPDPAAYVDTAARLAAEPERLAELRAGLRARMGGSDLCDGKGFAARMEAAYRVLWRRWCDGPAGAAGAQG